MSLTALSCTKYVKDRTTNFSASKVLFYRIGSTLKIVVADAGKLREIETYPEKHFLDLLIPKIQEVLDGKPWDVKEYYRPYYSVVVQSGVPQVLEDRYYNDLVISSYGSCVFKLRDVIPECGLKEVPKVPNAVTVDEWIARFEA